MRFDPWTFFFQIVNFAALLFILRRILYRPVREIMEKRRSLAAQAMAQAESARREADELKARRQVELEQMHLEKVRLTEEMHTEVEKERRGMLKAAGHEAERLLDRERALFEGEKLRYGVKLKENAVEAVNQFAMKLCRELADEQLHQALLRRLLEDRERIAGELRPWPAQDATGGIELLTAYPLGEDDERSLRELLRAATGRELPLKTTIDPDLVAGVKVRAGELIFDSSLSGQLAALARRMKEQL